MKKINLLFGIHNHQPIGNFDFVFEETYQKSYLPFIEILERRPKIRIAIHYSGILLDWFSERHPDYISRIQKMVASNQIEILTGGYYEPILSVIHPKDRLGQILKLTRKIKDIFGYDSKGMWLAERIWEPTLPGDLAEAGINYTILDDTHFKQAGLREENLHGYYRTEDLGNAVNLFPISKRLRYTIPFEDPQVTIDHIRSLAAEDADRLIVFADDGEKFGAWPNTFDHVYTNGWLEKFFTALENNLDWINIIHFEEAVQSIKPLGQIYLPTASYAEMGEWSLPSKASEEFVNFERYLNDSGTYEKNSAFVQGGFWRNFMIKYREVNDMHKRVLRLSKKLWSLPQNDQRKLTKAFDNIWAAQCNCPYWHGVFGGIYLSHIRDAVYSHLIEAEKELDHLNSRSFPNIEIGDFNGDGYEEVLIETKKLNAYFDLKAGGILYELDYKPLTKNILDTMTRRQENYHNKLKDAVAPGEQADHTVSIHDLVLAKEPNLKDKLHYDFYDRKSLIDHFFDSSVTLDEFASSQYQENGAFLNNIYKVDGHKINANKADLVLIRQGKVKGRSLLLSKKIAINNDISELTIRYKLQNLSSQPISSRFGVEFNFGLQAGHADDRYYYLQKGKPDNSYLDSMGEIQNSQFIGLRDEWRGLDIQLSADRPGTIWRFPIETVSLSEGGFERVYQSSAVLYFWDLIIENEWSCRFNFTINSMI